LREQLKIKLSRPDSSVYEKDKVESFIDRINELINKIDPDIDTTDLEDFKKLIELNKSYDSRDSWYIEDMESKINKYNEDLPF
jgi:hypothetical protein